MGFGPRPREHRWYTRMVVWFVCFLLGFLLVLHQSLTHTSYLSKSIWGLSRESISTYVGSGDEQSSILEAVTKQKPTFHANPTLLNHSTPSNSSRRSKGNVSTNLIPCICCRPALFQCYLQTSFRTSLMIRFGNFGLLDLIHSVTSSPDT